ncbi:UDP-N-acetylmuramoylalanine--D-glutamate ligase [Striga asiatica]|uniref:UDP-N-acetylmuramoylalanine--D-glutamate ligase n=1 Tax=Striga asiatica TaxID=4170 RepID=A0A5A7Q6T4_STRAF|nr:UDP-N-acetylmuramoylalanine--D-glutamate ligase [Striga asiatica]
MVKGNCHGSSGAAWRVLTSPEFLVARVLKEKYFSSGQFLDGVDARCPRCSGWESNAHIFFDRAWVKQLWKVSGDEFPNFASLLWIIWHERNRLKHGLQGKAVEQSWTLGWTWQEEISKWRSGHLLSDWALVTPSIDRWVGTGSCQNGLTLFCDAAVRDSEIGLGGWIGDSEGSCWAAFVSRIPGSFSSFAVEALALRFGLHFAFDLGVSIQFAKTDALVVICGLSEYSPNDPLHQVLQDYADV